MLKKLFAATMLCLSVGCSSLLPTPVGSMSIEYGAEVEVIEHQIGSNVTYQDYASISSELADTAKISLWSKKRLKSELSIRPKGGFLTVSVYDSTLEMANTKHYEVILISEAGEEIKRVKGDDRIASVIGGAYGPKFMGVQVISLEKKLSSPTKVYVVNTLINQRTVFLVKPKT
jgi:hypothetical protein